MEPINLGARTPDGIARVRSLRGWAGGFVHENETNGGEWHNPRGSAHAIVGFALTPFTTEFHTDGAIHRRRYAGGEGVLIAPGVPHTTVAFGRQRFAQCGLTPAFVTRVRRECFGETGAPPQRFVSRRFSADHRLMLLARLLHRELDFSDGPSFAVEAIAQALAIEVLREGPEPLPIPRASPAAGSKRGLLRVAQLLRERPAEAWSLAEAAALAGVSPFHFAREFKRVTGFAPHQYLLRVRVAAAATLIRQRKFSLAEVAQLAGFADQSHLTRLFKRVTGATPAKFARENAR